MGGKFIFIGCGFRADGDAATRIWMRAFDASAAGWPDRNLECRLAAEFRVASFGGRCEGLFVLAHDPQPSFTAPYVRPPQQSFMRDLHELNLERSDKWAWLWTA